MSMSVSVHLGVGPGPFIPCPALSPKDGLNMVGVSVPTGTHVEDEYVEEQYHKLLNT